MNPQEQAQFIAALQSDIASFSAFKDSIETKQVDFPLDDVSQDVLQKDLFIPTGNFVIPFSLIDYDQPVEIRVNDKKYYLDMSVEYK